MTTVARIELFHVAVPLPATFRPSWIPGFPQNENRFTLIRVTTDEGIEGYSAGPCMGHERAGLGELIGPYLMGADATDIGQVQQRLREMGYLGWRNWWIEPAFWDILGKRAGEPVYRLLGGLARRVPLYASTGEVKAPAERIPEAEARLAEGFRAVKLRVHDFDPAVDERQVVETSKAVGDRMKIGVDVNQAWRVTAIGAAPLWDLARAKRFCDVCADAGVKWVEEPLPMDAYADLAELTRVSRVPISGGELHTGGLPELRMMIERRCYSIFQPDAIFTGGIAQTLEIAKLARQHGLTYTPHTWTNGIGFAVNLQLYLATDSDKELEYPLNPPGWVPEARDGLLETPFLHERGELPAPTLPGLGFRIDPRALARHAKRFFVMDKKRLVWFSLRTRGLRASLEIDRARRASARAR
jgi:L-alanine-DL-glutamate epimerase-like enolase superfamily enzyme